MKKIVLLAAAVISGCATSPKGLEKPEFSSTFTVDAPYQLVLKRIVEADRECRPTQLVPIGQVINDVHNYPDLREAKIVQGASGVGTQIYVVISIKELQSNHSEVTLYARTARAKQSARLQRWAEGGGGCEF
ncbi:hypothetical protein ACCQ13_14840 [Xanthomonas sp. NCPPB 1638]|uniref:hypothetical protein n=1 Tax=Xanthomonas TaxID=338 RepID=UPI001AD7382E|nr:hypothetical protein [Xanthomonas cucurbitae]